MKATLGSTMGTEVLGHSAWPASDEAMYVAIARAWCRLVVPERRGLFPLGPYLLAPGFVESVARAPVDGFVVASVCAEVVSRHFSVVCGFEPELEREWAPGLRCMAPECVFTWWRALRRGDRFGVYYGELDGSTLEFVQVDRGGKRPSDWRRARMSPRVSPRPLGHEDSGTVRIDRLAETK